MIIFFDIGLLILLFLIFVIGGAKLILDNILLILLCCILLIVMLFALYKWPRVTFVVLCAFILITVTLLVTYVKGYNIAVHIYKASGECVVYDKEDNVVNIPSGAIIAKYQNEREFQQEGSFYGKAHVCYWYSEGETHNFFVSNRHEAGWDGCVPNEWNIIEVGEMKYRQFQKGTWMHDF